MFKRAAGGREARGELGRTSSQQHRQVGRTRLPGADAHLLSKPSQHHPAPGFLLGDIIHSLLFELVGSGFSVT